jgi:hypothetical protein
MGTMGASRTRYFAGWMKDADDVSSRCFQTSNSTEYYFLRGKGPNDSVSQHLTRFVGGHLLHLALCSPKVHLDCRASMSYVQDSESQAQRNVSQNTWSRLGRAEGIGTIWREIGARMAEKETKKHVTVF